MLWIKSFHVIFMVTWFAGLFYLPRLFIYHNLSKDDASHHRFQIMEYRLFVIMTIGGVLASVFGFWLLFGYAWAAFSHTGWLHLKLGLVGLLIAFHIYCYVLMRTFKNDPHARGDRFLRWFNEFPSIILIVVTILVIVKPF